jgi:hypothetical protein
MSVAVASAAAAALVLWPAQAAHALPDAQLDQIKQTIDRDFQQGQVSLLGPRMDSTTQQQQLSIIPGTQKLLHSCLLSRLSMP